MANRNKGTKETRFIKYSTRRIKRLLKLTIWLFILFLLLMAIIWAVPKVWNLALS